MATAIYSRQSIDKKDSISIETQIDFCKREALNEEIKVYIDKGYSGKNTERPKFKEMEKDIKAGLIKKVVVYKLDRISRNLLDFANIIDYYKKYEVSFVSCNEKFDTSTPMGNAMLSITMVFAQLERETIQKRVKDNYYARGKLGLYLGGRSSFGFIKIETRVEGKKTYTLKPDNEKIISLLKMYELYSETDMSLGKVSDYLNSNGILSAEGRFWDSGKISRLLRNPVYVMADADVYSYYKNKGCIISNDISEFIGANGCYLYGKRESNERKYTDVTDHTLSIALHEGVVTSSMWLACQYKLDANKQIKNTGKGKHSWLSGLMKCGKCGYSISVVVARDKRYLSCRGKTNMKTCSGFTNTKFADKIEQIMEELIFEQVDKIRQNDYPKQKIEDSHSNKFKIQIIEIDKKIENLISQLEEASKVTTKYINKRMEELDSEKNLLISEISKNAVVKLNLYSKEVLFKEVDNWSNLSMDEKKKIANFLIKKVSITDNTITRDWNKVF